MSISPAKVRELVASLPWAEEPYAYVSVLLAAVAEDEFADLHEHAWQLRAG